MPAGAEPPVSIDLAASDRQQFLRVRLGATPAGPRCQPAFDQIAKPLLGLLLLVAPDQVADVFAGVAVTACCDTVVDLRAHGLGQGKTHGLATHGWTLRSLITVVNRL